MLKCICGSLSRVEYLVKHVASWVGPYTFTGPAGMNESAGRQMLCMDIRYNLKSSTSVIILIQRCTSESMRIVSY